VIPACGAMRAPTAQPPKFSLTAIVITLRPSSSSAITLS